MVAVITGLIILLYLFVQLPFFQSFVAKKAASYLSGELETEISIQKLRITGFRTIHITGLKISDRHKDTLLYSGHIHIFLKQISVKRSFFELKRVSLEDTYFYLKTYPGDSVMNFSFISDYFSGGEKKAEGISPVLICHELNIAGLNFRMDDMNRPETQAGMDYNHLGIYDVELKAEEVRYAGDSVTARVGLLSARERCGIHLKSFQSDLKMARGSITAENLLLETNRSSLDMDLSFSYRGFNAFSYFIDSVRIKTDIRTSSLNFTDIGFFAPELMSMDNQIGLSGLLSGTVSNIKAKDFSFSYNSNTRFLGQVMIIGLPDLEETFLRLSVENLMTSARDIESFKLPGNKQIDVPQELFMAGNVSVKGSFTGFYYDFVSYATFRSELGRVNTDIMLKLEEGGDFVYSGMLSAGNFDIGKLIPENKLLGKIDFSLRLQGSGLTFETADIVMDGRIESVEFSGNIYDSISLAGSFRDKAFEGNLEINDEVIGLDFVGRIDLGNAIPRYNFKANIRDARPYALNLFDADSSLQISSHLDINFMGTKPDNMQGIIKIDSTFCFYLGKVYFMDNLTASLTGDSTDYRVLRLFSDFVDASVEGKMVFSDLWPAFLMTADLYLDTLIVSWDTLAAQTIQNFIFDVNLKKTDYLTELFVPGLKLTGETKINGLFNSQNNDIKVNVSSDMPEYQGIKFQQWKIAAGTGTGRGVISMTSDRVFLSDTLNVDSLNFRANVDNDSILFACRWKYPIPDYNDKGEIIGFVDFFNDHSYKIRLQKANMLIGEHNWRIGKENSILIDTSYIAISDFIFKSEKEKITINGIVSRDPADSLRVVFADFNLSNFNFLLDNLHISIDGVVNGSACASGIYNSINLISDIRVDDFSFNGERMGDALFVTAWDANEALFKLNADIIYTGNIGQKKILGMKGTFKPGNENNNYDIEIELDNYKLKTIQPFLSSFTSRIDGQASGKIHMSGKTNEPAFTGDVSLIHMQMLIDYLNVTYYFADKMYFDGDKIRFKDMIIYDSLNNQGVLSGAIDFGKFRKISLDLLLKTSNLASLNTTSGMNEQIYGKAHTTGEIKITGPADNLVIDIAVTTGEGTRVTVPVSNSVNLLTDYIVFMDPEAPDSEDPAEFRQDVSGLSMNFDLNVTPDAEIEIILPYRTGRIKGMGAGELKMAIDPKGNFTMNGDYEIRKGTLFLTLQNVVNRLFDISRGGRIWWTGDPYDAKVNLRAVYKVKTTLGEFAPDADSSARVPVDCIIKLSGKLLDPQFKFVIEFPDLSEDAKQYIYSRLDTTDQAVMNQQMVSLLVLNSFSTASGTSSGVGFNTFSLLSNQINNLLSRVSRDVDIGINYRPGDNLSQHEVELALSTQLFDDRVSIDGNVGVKGDQNTGTTENTNNIVGEVTVEVKITRDGRFRVKAFNKANNSYLYKNYSPYTQGVGIFYTQEFNRLSDLRRSKKKLIIKEVIEE